MRAEEHLRQINVLEEEYSNLHFWNWKRKCCLEMQLKGLREGLE